MLNLKNFYLNLKLDEDEYLWLLHKLFLKELVDLYHLDDVVAEDNYVHWKIQGNMCRLPQAGILTHQKLQKYLTYFRYKLVTFAASL